MEGDAQMANMTSGTDESQEHRSSPDQSNLANKLSQGASVVADQAIERVQRTRTRLEDQLTQRRSQLSERFRDVSEVLDSAGRKLGDDDVVADGLHYVSGKIERVASYIESADSTRLAEDVRDAVRERPAWFFGGAFVLGLALGRFAKSTAGAASMDMTEDEDEGSQGGVRRQRATGTPQREARTGVTGDTLPGTGGARTGTRESLPAARASGRPIGSTGTGPHEPTPDAARPPAIPGRQPGVRQP
jgi:hypothetical protein